MGLLLWWRISKRLNRSSVRAAGTQETARVPTALQSPRAGADAKNARPSIDVAAEPPSAFPAESSLPAHEDTEGEPTRPAVRFDPI